MIAFVCIATVLVSAYLIQMCYCAALIARIPRVQPLNDGQLPTVTILVAARNEEANILQCLQSLSALNYPSEKLNILIGNDRSTDATVGIVQRFIADKPQFRLIQIETDVANLRGKQNVLTQLAHHAAGTLLLVTDADIQVPPTWARYIASAFQLQPQPGMVSGPTVVVGTSLFARMQQMDWLFGTTLFQAFAQAGRPVTAVGNNMAVTRAAYNAIGGYEALPFSITEDFRLFQHISHHGYAVAWPFQPEVLNRSAAITHPSVFVQQRRRWYHGAREAPWYGVGIFYQQLMLHLAVLAAWLMLPWPWALTLHAAKEMADLILLTTSLRKLGLGLAPLRYFLPHRLFLALAVFAAPLLLLAPAQVNWKGRMYK